MIVFLWIGTVLLAILMIVFFVYLDAHGIQRGYTSNAKPVTKLPKVPGTPAPGAPLTREQHDRYRWDQFVEDDGDHH